MRRLAIVIAVPAFALSVLTGSAAVANASEPTTAAAGYRNPPRCC
jgi:hypothetical protein